MADSLYKSDKRAYHAEYARKQRKDNPEKMRNIGYKYKYGISLDTYNTLFEMQNGCCAICGKHQKDLPISLNVDHCHDSNKVRGLLCGSCNRGLGLFKDSVEFLNQAISYLKVGD